jgi:hypothetical protein
MFGMTIGTGTWQELQHVINMGRGGSDGRLPRGAAQLGASPTGDPNRLPEEWRKDIEHASHVVYHYGTPVAWIDSRDGGWVVPDVKYTPSTSGCQNRIREALAEYRETPYV